MDEQIYNGKNPSSSTIQTTLREAADFLQNIDNTDKKWRGLTYSEVTNLLKSFLLAANPTLDLENASTEELIRQLNILLSQEENLQSVVPKNLQSLIAEAEEAQGKAKIFEQRAAQDIKDYLERQRALLEKRNLQEPFRVASSTLEETVVKKLSVGLPAGNKRAIAEAVVNEPLVDVSFLLDLQKTANFSPQDRVEAELKIAERVHNTFQEAVPKALSKLRNQGIVVSPEEEETLLALIPTPSDLPLIAQQLYLPVNRRSEMTTWLNDQLLPAMTPKEARDLASILVPVVAEKLPEVDTKTLTHLTDSQFTEIKAQIEEAVVVSIAELAPELGEIAPKRFARIISTFTPQNKEELVNYTPILVIPKEKRSISLPVLITEPIEVTALPSRLPKIFASPLQRASEANPLHSTNESGIRVVDEIKNRLFKEGVSRGNALGFRNTVLRRWALNLTARGITPEDIDFTVQRLSNTGEKADSPRIKELKEIRQALVQHQQTLPTVLLERIKKHGVSEGFKGNGFVQLPTQYNTTIIRQTQFNPRLTLITRINSFLGRTLGKKVIVFSSGQIVHINKLNFAAHSMFENLKTGFYRTNIGRAFSSAFNQLAQKGLQSLFGLIKIGVRTGASAGLKTLGLQALSILLPGIGNLAMAAIQLGSSLVKRFFKGFLSGFGSFLGGLTGQRKVPDNKDLAFLLPIFIGVFVGIFALPFLSLLNVKNAMLPQLGGPGTPVDTGSFIVTKTVDKIKIENNQLPNTFTYTITVTAKDKNLTNLKITEVFKKMKDSSVTNISPSHPAFPTWDSIGKGENKTFTYSITLPNDPGYYDSFIINTVSVEAKVEGSDTTETLNASATISIGKPASCFVFDSSWSSADMNMELTAIAKIFSLSNNYSSNLCKGTITLSKYPGNNWCSVVGNTINITDLCLGNEENALYSLAHESGHIYAARNNSTYSDFVRQLYGSGGQEIERHLCSYPRSGLGYYEIPGEDFAETIGVYIMNSHYANHLYRTCNYSTLLLQRDAPIHYNFIKNLF